jgi:hypothetical protein
VRRVGVIACTFATLLGVAVVVAYRAGGIPAQRTGAQLYPHRTTTVHRVRAADGAPPLVVWLGDSTLQGNPEFPSYAVTLQTEALQPMGATSVVAAAPGMDFFGYWSLAGRVAALQPKHVIVIANLRTFIPQGGGVRGLTDTMAEIDLADLPRTLRLPYWVRGMTAPRLMLARRCAPTSASGRSSASRACGGTRRRRRPGTCSARPNARKRRASRSTGSAPRWTASSSRTTGRSGATTRSWRSPARPWRGSRATASPCS